MQGDFVKFTDSSGESHSDSWDNFHITSRINEQRVRFDNVVSRLNLSRWIHRSAVSVCIKHGVSNNEYTRTVTADKLFFFFNRKNRRDTFKCAYIYIYPFSRYPFFSFLFNLIARVWSRYFLKAPWGSYLETFSPPSATFQGGIIYISRNWSGWK